MTDDPAVSIELSTILTQMSGLLITQETVRTALELVVDLAQQTHPSTVGAGVSLLGTQKRVTTAATGPLVERADGLQYELDEGPCITAWQTREVIRVDDIATDSRWPRWTAAVASLDLRSSLSAPMVAGDDAMGAIKLYAPVPGSYTEHDEQVLMLFAQQAAILLANVRSYESAQRLTEQLNEALAGRDVIGQAKGIIMSQQGVDETEAFATLVRLSQRSHRKLRDVARQVIETTMRKPT